ncbi:UNVERIFIED_CONTAM: hypothetical protein Sradi_2546500 [Sesamum radiatum]|uniref:Uncharacterized protein n=1 Tax=Sesamum radiatum TaxID=300843 RepID=A0AAW2SLT7_SESRA
MGQALRRATGRIGSSRVDTSTTSQLGKPIERRPSAPPAPAGVPVENLPSDDAAAGSEGASVVNAENVLEDRDPEYDAMLSQMVGRIRSKPGGKLEMGEASVVEKYKRPLPKVRNTTPESGRYEQRPVPPGTLNVAQVRQIILLHQGKSDDHDGPMDVPQIAERFRIDGAQVAVPPMKDSLRRCLAELIEKTL